MMRKDNTLTKIDNYFDEKKPSEVTMMLIVAFFLSVAIAYYAVIPYVQNYYDDSIRENDQITQDLNKVNSYLSTVSQGNDRNFMINKKQNELLQQQNKLADAQNMNQYFDNKLKELSYLIFNEQSWADFLDNLAFLANKNNVKITKIINTFKEPNAQKIEQVLDVNISVDGDYRDIVSYINAIEESKLVVDVNNIDIN